MATLKKEKVSFENEIPEEPKKLGIISYGLRYLRKKDGSMVLQEGVNEVWSDIPMVIEK